MGIGRPRVEVSRPIRIADRVRHDTRQALTHCSRDGIEAATGFDQLFHTGAVWAGGFDLELQGASKSVLNLAPALRRVLALPAQLKRAGRYCNRFVRVVAAQVLQ